MRVAVSNIARKEGVRMARLAIDSTSHQLSERSAKNTCSRAMILNHCVLLLALTFSLSARAQGPLPLSVATQLAADRAPIVNAGTLLAFAWFESKLQPWAIHDNTTLRSEFPASRDAEAIAHASTLVGQKP